MTGILCHANWRLATETNIQKMNTSLKHKWPELSVMYINTHALKMSTRSNSALLNRGNFTATFPFIYFDLRNKKLDVNDGIWHSVTSWVETNADYTVTTLFFFIKKISKCIYNASGKLTIQWVVDFSASEWSPGQRPESRSSQSGGALLGSMPGPLVWKLWDLKL